jgi:hypothetical protein
MLRKVGRALAVPLVTAIAVVVLESCSLFTNLDVNGYTSADAGKADASLCPAGISCVLECTSSADCQQGDVCCLTLNSLTFRSTCCAGGQLRMPDDGGDDGDGGDGGDE